MIVPRVLLKERIYFPSHEKIRRHYRDRRRQLRRIQLMELPYRSSIGASEERGSTILIPSISPQVVNEENASNSMNPPQKVTSFSATVSLLLNRSRQASLKRQGSTDSKVFTQRQISKTIEIQQDQYADDEDDTDCRVSVVWIEFSINFCFLKRREKHFDLCKSKSWRFCRISFLLNHRHSKKINEKKTNFFRRDKTKAFDVSNNSQQSLANRKTKTDISNRECHLITRI